MTKSVADGLKLHNGHCLVVITLLDFYEEVYESCTAGFRNILYQKAEFGVVLTTAGHVILV
jgi:hypothetical protein